MSTRSQAVWPRCTWAPRDNMGPGGDVGCSYSGAALPGVLLTTDPSYCQLLALVAPSAPSQPLWMWGQR